MKYSKVYIESFGYELAPVVVSSKELEKRLAPVYDKLHFKMGQLEALTGIRERRFWPINHTMHEGAAKAGKKAIEAAGISPSDIGMLIYGGVCRDNLEPATSCAVAHALDVPRTAQVFDVSNACLGVMTGIIQVANAIELGQIQAGLVVSCESSRQIVESTIERLNTSKDMDVFKKTIATMTGGSGAAAVLLVSESVAQKGHRLMGGVVQNAVEHNTLCTWGPDTGMPSNLNHIMETDAVGVLNHGVALGKKTYEAFRREFNLSPDEPDKIICHQVGSAHQKTILESININEKKDFTTFRFLGNIGTVSLPITAAIAEERDFFNKGDTVGLFGIGSGLNCLLLGVKW
jgi:3-oxoacyl-[acyl-carrier-protein] synthase-3